MIHPEARWNFKLPVEVKIAIADAIVIFSRIETCVLEMVWAIKGADLNQKRKLAKRRASENFTELKNFMTLPDVETDAIWQALTQITDDRHIIAHGSWMVIDDIRPFVMWHKLIENDDTFIGEYFDYTRFEMFMKKAEKLLETFTALKIHLEDLRANLDRAIA